MLSRIADTAAQIDNDGVVDVGYNACAMSDADARKIGSGITLLYRNIITTSGSFATAMSEMTTICALAGATCTKTDSSTFTAAELVAIRGTVDYNRFGIGADAVYPSCP